MIGGFILRGGENTKVVTRALGPSLAKLRVANVIQNPSLELHDKSGTLIGSNNDWRESQESAITASQLAPADDREAALVTHWVRAPTPQLFAGEPTTWGSG